MSIKTINVYRLALEFALTLPFEDMVEFMETGLQKGFYRETRFGWPEALQNAREKEQDVSGKIRKAIAKEYFKGETAMAKAGEAEVIRILAEELDIKCHTER